VKTGNVDDGESRLVVNEFCLGRLNEHIPGEQGVPGPFGDHPYWQAMCGACASKTILNEQVLTVQERQQPIIKGLDFA